MTKKIFITIGVIAVVAIGVLFILNKGDKKHEIINIGAILPMTGDLANYAISLKKGMDLAVEEINSKGGINNALLNVIYEDDKGEAKNAISAYRKLVDIDKVQMVIGGMFSVSTFAIAPLAEKEHKVLLSPTASAIELTTAGDYIFRIYPSDIYDGIFLSEFAAKSLSARKIAIAFEQVASITAISNRFKENFEALGGIVVFFEGYNSDIKDFSSILKKIDNIKPDLVFIPGNINSMANFLIQAKKLNIKYQYLTISTFYDPKIIELAKDATEGILFSSPMFDPNSENKEVKLFVQLYQTKYNATADILGGYGYDVVNIAGKSLQNGNIADAIKNNLYQIKDFPGVTGTTTFNSNGDVDKELRIMTVKGGKFEPYIK
ncbi:MAG: ABC transporter substrate-binding protein [Bacteroidales bacterium]|jgi:branched-chain amino acid transport system substrate-binding protein|nr:ABC transporter substrate-binding protein [Bacteroidales bacterium]